MTLMVILIVLYMAPVLGGRYVEVRVGLYIYILQCVHIAFKLAYRHTGIIGLAQ